jgi:glycosyltransferase involved in cell wall biosynthesis
VTIGSTPTVSIVTPAFNRADYLPHTIDSVLAQSYPDFEHIIIDDGSSDGTDELIRGYTDRRIRYFQQANQGQSVARNVGIEASRGEYICFLDSDDLWLPNKLEEQLALFADDPGAGVVYGDKISIDGSGHELHRRNMRRYSGWITGKLLADNFVSMNTTMTRAELLRQAGGFDASDRYAEDYGLWLRVSLLARFHYSPSYWVYYRIMAGQLSSDKITRLAANERLLQQFLADNNHGLQRDEIRQGLSRFYARKARTEAAGGARRAALRSIARAISYSPWRTGCWRSGARVLMDISRPSR